MPLGPAGSTAPISVSGMVSRRSFRRLEGDALTEPGHTLRGAAWNRLPAESQVKIVELAPARISCLLGTGSRAALVFEQRTTISII